MIPSEHDLLATAFRRRADVAQVELDGETVVFQPDRESLTVLDPLGTVVWTLLDGSVPLRTLSEELAEAYRAPLSQVQHDLLELVLQLRQDELLVSDPA